MNMKEYTASTCEKAAHDTLRRAYEICERRIDEAVARERERCAKVAESYFPVFAQYAADLHGKEIAAAIRAGPEEGEQVREKVE